MLYRDVRDGEGLGLWSHTREMVGILMNWSIVGILGLLP